MKEGGERGARGFHGWILLARMGKSYHDATQSTIGVYENSQAGEARPQISQITQKNLRNRRNLWI